MTSETLNDLFHPDNIKNFAQGGEKISESNYNLWNNLGGPQGLLAALKTHAKTGIEGSKDDISSRVNKFGSNKKRIPKIRTLWELVCENFEDTILQILLLAALVALVIGVV